VPSGFASVRTAMNRFGCVIEQLLDGSVLADRLSASERH
jgi:hypothetical protein